MCSWLDGDDGLTIEERQEQRDEYNRLHPYLRYMRRRGMGPGDPGFKPATVLASCFIFMIAILLTVQALSNLGDPSMYLFLIMGPAFMVFSVLYPIWAFRADDRIRQRSEIRRRQQEEEMAAEEGRSRPELRARSVEDAEEEDDKVWIPGRTHEPVGSEPTEEEERENEEILKEHAPVRSSTEEDDEETEELLQKTPKNARDLQSRDELGKF